MSTVELKSAFKMSIFHKLTPLFQINTAIGLCPFSVNSNNSTLFHHSYYQLIYSIIYSISTTTICISTLLPTIFNFFINTKSFITNVNRATDIIHLIIVFAIYFTTLYISLKYRHRHLKFLNRLASLDIRFKIIAGKKYKTIGIYPMMGLVGIYVLCYAIGISYVVSDSNNHVTVINRLYKIIVLFPLATNLMNEIYLNFLISIQWQRQSALTNLFMEKNHRTKFSEISLLLWDFYDLKLDFGKTFNGHIVLMHLRYFSILIVSIFSFVINFSNLKLLQIGAVFLNIVRWSMILLFVNVTNAMDKLAKQVIISFFVSLFKINVNWLKKLATPICIEFIRPSVRR